MKADMKIRSDNRVMLAVKRGKNYFITLDLKQKHTDEPVFLLQMLCDYFRPKFYPI